MIGGNEDAGHIQHGGVRARAGLRGEDRSAAPGLGLGHSRVARPRRGGSTPDLHRGAVETRRRRRRRSSAGQPAHSHEAGETDEPTRSSGPTNFVVDSTTEVLLERMQNIARLIGMRVAAGRVAAACGWPGCWPRTSPGCLMLNERRTLGLMRLRGISGELMGRALLVSVVGRRRRRRRARPHRRVGGAALDLRARQAAARACSRPAADGDLRRVPG